MKNEEDKFGIILGTLMIIGTLLPYISFFGVEDNIIGTESGYVVIIGGIITIISGIFFSRIRVGYIIGGIVSLIGMYDAGIYNNAIYNAILSKLSSQYGDLASDLASLINSEIGYYVILLSSVVAIIDGAVSLIKCLFKR